MPVAGHGARDSGEVRRSSGPPVTALVSRAARRRRAPCAEEVLELRRLFGSPDYFVRVAVADLPAYGTFLGRCVMTIPRIKNVTSHFAMKTVKPGPQGRTDPARRPCRSGQLLVRTTFRAPVSALRVKTS
ncbi:Lrp/AsnC ligand binding domain-containing protein [Streptomyces sp. NPDC001980]|uniref:Lrp/AsnC ligand binding domain-containing protein n=1 Tax=Streptomyces sp. NPDC001980 TaxID=3157126 RepID=UPI00331C3C50